MDRPSTTTVDAVRKIIQHEGDVSPAFVMRRFKVTFEKAQELIEKATMPKSGV
jgi:hypothetical protein